MVGAGAGKLALSSRFFNQSLYPKAWQPPGMQGSVRGGCPHADYMPITATSAAALLYAGQQNRRLQGLPNLTRPVSYQHHQFAKPRYKLGKKQKLQTLNLICGHTRSSWSGIAKPLNMQINLGQRQQVRTAAPSHIDGLQEQK